MKKLLIAAALLCTFSVQAQNTKDMKKMTPQERAERRSKMMEQKLNLNADQAQQIRKINTETATRMEAPMTRTHEDRALLKEINQNREAEYKRVLTTEQYSAYEAQKANRKNKMGDRMNKVRSSQNVGQPQRILAQPAQVR